MSPEELQTLIEDATFDFSMGDNEVALEKLKRATSACPESFEAWHHLAEIALGMQDVNLALNAAEQAHRLRPDDLFINTTLSRIWVGKGDKAKAEHFGAQAKIQGWKDQLQNPDKHQGGLA